MKIRCLFDIGVYLMAELVVWMCCCFGSHSNIPEMLMIAIETAIDDDDGVSYVPFCSHFFLFVFNVHFFGYSGLSFG